MQSKLLQGEQRFRLLAENSKDMIYRMSVPDGLYDYVSPASAEITGYTPVEFYESPMLMRRFIHPDWRGYLDGEWSRLIDGDMPPSYEYQMVHKSGEVRWLRQRNTLIRNDEGRPVAIEGAVSDITDLQGERGAGSSC